MVDERTIKILTLESQADLVHREGPGDGAFLESDPMEAHRAAFEAWQQALAEWPGGGMDRGAMMESVSEHGLPPGLDLYVRLAGRQGTESLPRPIRLLIRMQRRLGHPASGGSRRPEAALTGTRVLWEAASSGKVGSPVADAPIAHAITNNPLEVGGGAIAARPEVTDGRQLVGEAERRKADAVQNKAPVESGGEVDIEAYQRMVEEMAAAVTARIEEFVTKLQTVLREADEDGFMRQLYRFLQGELATLSAFMEEKALPLATQNIAESLMDEARVLIPRVIAGRVMESLSSGIGNQIRLTVSLDTVLDMSLQELEGFMETHGFDSNQRQLFRDAFAASREQLATLCDRSEELSLQQWLQVLRTLLAGSSAPPVFSKPFLQFLA